MTEVTGPLAEPYAAYDVAVRDATDALLDVKLANDAPAQSLSHPFTVAAAMLHWMDKQLLAIHALDRVVLRAKELAGPVPEQAAGLSNAREHMVNAWEKMRVDLARVVDELATFPSFQPPRLS